MLTGLLKSSSGKTEQVNVELSAGKTLTIAQWMLQPEAARFQNSSNIAIPHTVKTKHRLANVVSFVGTGGPRLMLTQEPEYDYPYYALLLVNTSGPNYTESYAREVRNAVANIPQARITVDLFMLGPPIKDPVAFRLSGQDADTLRRKAREMVGVFKGIPGTKEPYSNWGATGYQVDVKIDPYAANLAGVTNADIAFTTRALLSGAHLTTYREGDHQVPVLMRTLRASCKTIRGPSL